MTPLPGLFVVALIEIALVLVVLARNPRATANRRFAVLAAAAAAWSVLLGARRLLGDPDAILIAVRTIFAAATLIPMGFFRFAVVFPGPSTVRPEVVRGVTVVGLLISALAFSPWMVTDIEIRPQLPQPMYGPLHRVFSVYLLTVFVWALVHLARKLRQARGFARSRLQHVFVGVTLASLGAITTNLVVPLVFGTSRFSVYGPYFTLIWVGFTAHSIIRHRLMDIRVVISRSAAYAASWTLISGLLIAGAVYLTPVLRKDDPALTPAATVAFGLIAAMGFVALAPRMKRLADRYLYRPAYDARQLVRDGSRTMATFAGPERVAEAMAKLIGGALRLESLAILVRERDRNELRPVFTQHVDAGFVWPREGLSTSSRLVRGLDQRSGMLTVDDLARHASREEAAATLRDMGAWAADIAVPVSGERELIAAILAGPKLSGDPFFGDDLDLLETLASQLAIGLDNAQLYRQIVAIKEHNERVLAHMDSGVVAIRDDGTVTTFNPAAERSTGLIAAEVIGRSFTGLDGAVQSVLEDSLAGQQDTEREISVTHSDGRTLPLVIHTSPLHDGNGQVSGAIAVFNDHSRLKALEEDKRRAERLAAVGALASGVAHEIRNPLVAIKTFAELLPERADDQEFRSAFAKVAAKEIHRIEELLGRLRALAVPATSSLRPMDLTVPVLETLDLLRGEADRRRIRVETDIEAEVPPVIGEPAQLKQLFLNLFLNSLEAMAAGGTLSVTLRSDRNWHGRQLVTARVADTGPGIPREDLSRIFEPFFTTKRQGTGLGLAISRGICDAHRAALWAELGPHGVGTVFVLQFPAFVDAPVPEPVP